MTDEANIAEAELAKEVELAKALFFANLAWHVSEEDEPDINTYIARALLAAGYRKRSDVLEECRQTILADAGAWGDAAFSLAEQIANLKDKP